MTGVAAAGGRVVIVWSVVELTPLDVPTFGVGRRGHDVSDAVGIHKAVSSHGNGPEHLRIRGFE
jgi:hypothetical protein